MTQHLSMNAKYVECPRDSWQGLTRQIPTQHKISYLQKLLDAGFKHLDMGSFVSPKAVPQLVDTEAVLAGLTKLQNAELLCIIANAQGLKRALAAKNLTSVGYPLSVSDTFQRRNTRRSLADSWTLVKKMSSEARAGGLKFVVYLSMGFGNPYGEGWQPQDTADAVARLRDTGAQHIALADTVGTATPERVAAVLERVKAPERLGLHLHARPDAWKSGLETALSFGLTWFEGALAGVGGCPFAADDLVANLSTEQVLPWLSERLEGLEVPSKLPQLAETASALARDYT